MIESIRVIKSVYCHSNTYMADDTPPKFFEIIQNLMRKFIKNLSAVYGDQRLSMLRCQFVAMMDIPVELRRDFSKRVFYIGSSVLNSMVTN